MSFNLGELTKIGFSKQHAVHIMVRKLQASYTYTNYKLNCKLIYERSYIWTAEKDMIDHRSHTHNLSSCEIKAWKNKVIIQARTRFTSRSYLSSLTEQKEKGISVSYA